MSAALAIRHEITRALPLALQSVREPAKVIALRTGVTQRTIEAARQAEHGISAASLLALAKQYPAVKSLVLRLIDAEPGQDTRLLTEIQNMIARAGK